MVDLPKSYKAAIAQKPNEKLVIKDVPLKLPGHGEVLVKVKACGVCHSDSTALQGYMNDMGCKWPLTPGHEIVGNVAAIPDSETHWKIGDYVGGAWEGGHCLHCNACKRGLFQMCEKGEVNGVHRDGGYAEYVLLRSEAVVTLPPDVDAAEIAPLLCAGVTVFNGMRNMNVRAGGIVAIQGLGGLGHLALQYSRKLGFRTVALSSSGAKKDFATKLGATDYVDASAEDTVEALNKLGGADLIVCTAPNPKVVGSLENALAPLGKLLVVALAGEVPVNTISLINKGLSVHGWPSGSSVDSEDAILMAQTQGIKCLVEKFPFDQAQEALDHMLSGKARFRAVLMMD